MKDKKPNNKILLEHILNHTDRDQIKCTGKELQFAKMKELRLFVEHLGDDPDQVIADFRAKEQASSGNTTTSSPIANLDKSKREALEILLNGSNGVDEDKVQDIVRDVIDVDVKPVMDELGDKVDKLAPLTDTLDKIAKAMNGSTNKCTFCYWSRTCYFCS